MKVPQAKTEAEKHEVSYNSESFFVVLKPMSVAENDEIEAELLDMARLGKKEASSAELYFKRFVLGVEGLEGVSTGSELWKALETSTPAFRNTVSISVITALRTHNFLSSAQSDS